MKIGIAITVRARSFSEKRALINRLVRDGVVKCTQCAKSATHVYWQDQEEWYEHCEDHRDYGQQWTGSTRGRYPRMFDVVAVSDVVHIWHAALPPDEQSQFEVSQYDATDYYALMFDDMRYEEHLLSGNKLIGTCAKIYPLTDGTFAYQIERHWTSGNGSGTFFNEGLIGGFDSADSALSAARTQAHAPEVPDQDQKVQ